MKEFKYMTPLQAFIILFGAGSLGILSFSPNLLPCHQLGNVGDGLCTFAKEYNNGLKTAFFVLVFIHILEGLVAWKLSRDLEYNTLDQMKWLLQTLYGGIFSLRPLMKIKAGAKKQA